ncbi:hypothetical protein WJX81_006774 [Elliptochloris bilobata]|uniref:Uncharacterized protein n=1 Tax=Elliptochloris bilobata TaxID=381761 RepID=A0AAW1RYQ0_9CHLO
MLQGRNGILVLLAMQVEAQNLAGGCVGQPLLRSVIARTLYLSDAQGRLSEGATRGRGGGQQHAKEFLQMLKAPRPLRLRTRPPGAAWLRRAWRAGRWGIALRLRKRCALQQLPIFIIRHGHTNLPVCCSSPSWSIREEICQIEEFGMLFGDDLQAINGLLVLGFCLACGFGHTETFMA